MTARKLTRWAAALAAAFALTLTAAACGDDDTTDTAAGKTDGDAAPAIEIVDPFARTPGMNNVGAVYFTVRNTGDADDALVAADSDIAGDAQVHETVMQDGGMKMQEVDRIDIPAGGEVTLEPGGYHVMLLDLKQELKEGDTVTVTLTFEQAGEVSVEAEVVAYTPAEEEADGMGGMDHGNGDAGGMDMDGGEE